MRAMLAGIIKVGSWTNFFFFSINTCACIQKGTQVADLLLHLHMIADRALPGDEARRIFPLSLSRGWIMVSFKVRDSTVGLLELE